MEAPEGTYLPDCYRFTWPQARVSLSFDRLHESRGDLVAELSVSTERPPNPGILLPMTRVSIEAPTWRRQAKQDLDARDEDVDWGAILIQAIQLTLARWRMGEPLIDARFTEAQRGPRWLLEPYLEERQPTVLFADGGTGKSLFATSIALTVASRTGPVLYLDWETEYDTFRERLLAVAAGYDLDLGEIEHQVFYRRQWGSLYDGAAPLRKIVSERGIVLVIVDSLGYATLGDEGREGVIKTFLAVRSMNATGLFIDHVTKAAGADATRPYGTAYTHNGARRSFRLERAPSENDDIVLALTNFKYNNTRPVPKHAFRVHFETDDDDLLSLVSYKRVDWQTVPEIAARSSLAEHVLGTLKNQGKPETVERIRADINLDRHTEVSADSMRSILSRLKKRGQAVSRVLDDGIVLWSATSPLETS